MNESIDYLYTHSFTHSTTGYFSCEPRKALSLEEALAMLNDRPLDSFLHAYILKQILTLPPGEIAQLTNKYASSPQEQILALLLAEKTCLATGESASQLDQDLTPMLAFGVHHRKDGARQWQEHINSGKPVGDCPAPDDFETIRARFNDHASILAKEASQIGSQPINDIDPHETYARATEYLTEKGLLLGSEMRHEASLSPIALLRKWKIECKVSQGRNSHRLMGEATAYGRGLTLAQARASCIMEVMERAAAYVDVRERGGKTVMGGHLLTSASPSMLARNKTRFYHPEIELDIQNIVLNWLEGTDALGNSVLVPAQAVFLFSNLDEPDLFGAIGSTGLASGNTWEQAKLAALTEIVERDSHATTPWDPSRFFIPKSRDTRLAGLLNDYLFRNIHIVMQDITSEIGLPAFRSLILPVNGDPVLATGASLDGKKAALSALTETPWPYAFSNPMQRSSPTRRVTAPEVFLEDLAAYSSGSISADIRILEQALIKMGHCPIYVDLSRDGWPITRAFIPGLEYGADFDGLLTPSDRLITRYKLLGRENAGY